LFVENSVAKRLLEMPRHRCEDNIKLEPEDFGWEDVA
jgi:hypothetical protein